MGGDGGEMPGQIDKTLSESRSLEEALADLRAKYDIHPTPELARMIRQLQAEIAERKQLQQEPPHDGASDGERVTD